MREIPDSDHKSGEGDGDLKSEQDDSDHKSEQGDSDHKPEVADTPVPSLSLFLSLVHQQRFWGWHYKQSHTLVMLYLVSKRRT